MKMFISKLASEGGSLQCFVRDLLCEVKKNVRLIKRMKDMGASNREIASAIGLTEEEVEMLT